MENAIGWASSLVLLLTIGAQVAKQWREGSSRGVSKWLFIGQVAASVGFVVYSWMVQNWIFVFTNALILVSAIVGMVIVLRNKRREAGQAGSTSETRAPARSPSETRAQAREAPERQYGPAPR